MTVCNMSIEAGARAGMIAVDDTTIEYLAGRPYAPPGALWDQAVAAWRDLHSDADAGFDNTVVLDAADIAPQVTWGTSPEMVVPSTASYPIPTDEPDRVRREGMRKALAYMGLQPGMPITHIHPDHVFIGSCTNARIEDLRAAAAVVRGRKVAPGIKLALVVPGSGLVKRQAEAEGLDRVFRAAGFEWRDPGCSMCLAMNADRLAPGERCASTSNRNFEGRQGQGGRTHLVSPGDGRAGRRRRPFRERQHRYVLGQSHYMEKFSVVAGMVAPLDRANVDTDAIIPKQFLKSIKRSGFGPNLFDEWRYLDHGEPGLDKPARAAESGLCPERSHATRVRGYCWPGKTSVAGHRASMRYGRYWTTGFRVVIAPSFADIFFNNCFKNGVLPVVLPAACRPAVPGLPRRRRAIPWQWTCRRSAYDAGPGRSRLRGGQLSQGLPGAWTG